MVRTGNWVKVLVVGAIMLLALGNLVSDEGAEAQLNPTSLEVTLEPATGHIDVSPDGNRSTEFTAHISVTTLPIVVTTINITSSAGDWYNETSEDNIVLTGNRDADVQVIVYAPYDVLSGDTQTVQVTISWTTSLNEAGENGASATAVVDQVYRVNVYAPTTYRSVYPGDSITMKVYASNFGNGDDTLSIKLTNYTHLASAGWTLKISKISVFVDADEQEIIEVDIKVPTTAALQLETFRVNVTSDGALDLGKNVSDDVSIRLKVKEKETNGGNGSNGNGNGDDDKPDPICSIEMIPVVVLLPLGAVSYGTRVLRGRLGGQRRRRGPGS